MQAVRWTSMKMVAVGPSGRQTPFDGRVRETNEYGNVSTGISVAITILLIGLGLFMPPFLLLGIPILLFRAAIAAVRMGYNERIAMSPFDCPECQAQNAPVEQRGSLPLEVPCGRCGATLLVGQMPRIYAADAVTGGPPPTSSPR